MKIIFLKIFLVALLAMQTSMAEQILSKGEVKENIKKRLSKIPVFNEKETSVKNPFDLRDPFKRKNFTEGSKRTNLGGFLKDGKYSNLPTINDFSLSRIRVVGVLLGKQRRAIAKISNRSGTFEKLSDESYIIKEGMVLGENNAEVKAIVPGGIVLVEKIKNVYDQEEYIETVIPVSVPSVKSNQKQ